MIRVLSHLFSRSRAPELAWIKARSCNGGWPPASACCWSMSGSRRNSPPRQAIFRVRSMCLSRKCPAGAEPSLHQDRKSVV